LVGRAKRATATAAGLLPGLVALALLGMAADAWAQSSGPRTAGAKAPATQSSVPQASAAQTAVPPPTPAPAALSWQERSDIIGEMSTYVTKYEDTLPDIGVRFNIGFIELVAANPGVDPWVPGAGREIILPTAYILPDAPRRGIIVNLTEMRVYYFPKVGAPETHPIGIGRDDEAVTPLGITQITRKAADPTWYPPASVRAEKPELPGVVPPGPDNPLGKYAFYLGFPLVRMHGTNKPYGVGRRVSHGCIRMYPDSIEHLYQVVPVGTQVNVIDQPIKFGWWQGDLYIEVSPSKHQADELETQKVLIPDLPEGLLDLATKALGDQADRLDLGTLLQAGIERRGYPIRITY